MGSFAELGMLFAKIAVEVSHAGHKGLEKAAVIVETAAKEAMGGYSFGWPELKPATIERKVTGDSPLLETGALQASIGHTVGELEALVGTNDPKAKWMELGTSRIPPRPFLMGAVTHKHDEIVHAVGEELKTVITFR